MRLKRPASVENEAEAYLKTKICDANLQWYTFHKSTSTCVKHLVKKIKVRRGEFSR